MFTRQDYLSGKCSHSDYYGQFITPQIIANIKTRFGVSSLLSAFKEDQHFNNIPLYKWGYYNNGAKFKELGDFWSIAGAVCVEKEAARQIVESFNVMDSIELEEGN